MLTPTIETIKTLAESAETVLENFVVKDHEGVRFGVEEEYDAASLKAEIKTLVREVRRLANAHDKFFRMSTHTDRANIQRILESIHDLLSRLAYSNVVSETYELKIAIRPFVTKSVSETEEELEESVNKIRNIDLNCEGIEEQIQTLLSRSEDMLKSIQSAQQQKEDFLATLGDFHNRVSQLEILEKQVRGNSETVNELLNSAKSHEEIVKNFSQQVSTRTQEMTNQAAKTSEYDERLISYADKMDEIREAAEGLIQQARDALGYTTAVGISAAFDERYKEDKKSSVHWIWAGAAGFLVIASILVGVWFWVKGSGDLSTTLSRITIMSVAISAAWFCASQYVKSKNIMEDYGYKAVLTKSMVAFLDQLEGTEREKYLAMVLLEIHKDPLRKRHDDSASVIKRVTELFGGGSKTGD